jgi:Flp pilus assembly protein TadG
MTHQFPRQKGFTLIASAACAFAIFGSAGLAIDIGRVYIAKNEAQTFADSAALYAALQLDGTATGLTNADNAVTNNVNKWNFATSGFSGTVVEYSADGSTGWHTRASVTSPTTQRYVRVTPTVNNVPLFFLPVIGTATRATVKAQAIGGQVLKATFPSGGAGVFPFSPIAHAWGSSTTAVHTSDPTDNFGFTVGTQYTLRWPSNPNTSNFNNVCPGDAMAQWVSKANASDNSERGYIQMQSANQIRDAIISDHLDYGVSLNNLLNVNVDTTNGAKSAERDAIQTRIGQDHDTTDTTYSAYRAGWGNGRRLVTVVVQSGFRDQAGVLLPANQTSIGVGYAQFLLLPANQYDQAGNKPWCAVYVGNAPLEDAVNTGGVGANGQGVSYVRLSQ